MGVPHFGIDDNNDFWEDKINFYNEFYIKRKQNIQLLSHRDGTAIIWPWYSAKNGMVVWKHISPASIYKIIVDPFTEEMTALMTCSTIYYYDDRGYNASYLEEITYTEKQIIINRKGKLPNNISATEARKNPSQILPIFFSNGAEPGEIEGHSDYERILPYIKAYSEINIKAHETLLNLGAKLVQSTDDVATWLDQNGFSDINDIDVSSMDFIINRKDKEESKFEIPQNILEGHLSLMKNDFLNIVESSGIPEIVWGVKMQGNHASAQEQMGVLLSFVDEKQKQADASYRKLLEATLYLESIANNQTIPKNVNVIWNDIDSFDQLEKSTIFKNWSDGIGRLIESKAIDLQSAHGFLYQLSKGKITDSYEEFKKGIIEHGSLVAFLSQDYGGIRETTETDI
jgi:hypothetical protein